MAKKTKSANVVSSKIPHTISHRSAGTLGGAAIVIECFPFSVMPLFYEFQSPMQAAAFVMRLEKGSTDTRGLIVSYGV